MALAAGFLGASANLMGMLHWPAAADLCGLGFAFSTFFVVGTIEAHH